MKSKHRHETDENVLALCRQEGSAWRVLIVRDASGTPAVLNAVMGSEIDAREALAEHNVGRVLMAMPSWAYLVRTIRLPKGNEQQLMSALRLESETRLLGATPDHRQGMAILAASTSRPVGLVCSWPLTLQPTACPMPPGNDLNVTWAPDIVALAIATDGQNEFAATFDQESGALALVVPTPNGPVYRSTREPTAQGENWSIGVMRVVRETLLNEGVKPTDVESESLRAADSARTAGCPFIIPSDADRRLTADLNDAEDLLDNDNTGGWRLLLGLFQARHSHLAPLTMLRTTEQIERPSLLTTMRRKLATPRFATAVVAACVAIVVLTPLAATGLRLTLIRSKIANERALQSSVQRTENLIEIYRALSSEAWSMTKLLGDIASCMPETLEASGFVLSHGEPVSIEGISKTEGSNDGSEAVLAFAHRLRATGLFENVEPSFSPPDGRGVRNFSVTADVRLQSKPIVLDNEDDYAIVTYSERRWGKVDEDGYLIGATTTPREDVDPPPSDPSTAPLATNEDNASPTEPKPDRTRTSQGGDSRAASSSSTSRGAPRSRSEGRGEPPKVPDPVTSEEVAVMNRSEALTRLTEVAEAKNRPGTSEELKKRLGEDFDLLMQRVRETAP